MQKLRVPRDLGGDEWNASLLNEAYQVLSDPETRKAHDRDYFGDRSSIRHTARQSAGSGTRPASGKPYGSRFDADPATCPFCRTPRPATPGYGGPADCPGCGAPLDVATTLRLADTSKRAIERVCHREALILCLSPDDEGQQGTVRDLSPNGMQLQCGLPLRLNQVVRITCPALAAVGRVTS